MDRGFVVQTAERTRDGLTEVHLIGRLENGETFAVIERRRKPFFYVRAADAALARKTAEAESPGSAITTSECRTMDGAETARIETLDAAGSQRLRDLLHRSGARTYEADVKLFTQLLMDRGIHGTLSIDGPWRAAGGSAEFTEDPALAPSDHEPRLTTLSLDIETDARATTVYAVSLAFSDPAAGTESGEVLLQGSGHALPAGSNVRCFRDEREMLTELRRRIVELDPDVITGWNVVDFDFRVLARRFSALRVPFDIGRSDGKAAFLDRESSDGITRWNRSKAIVPGRQVLDSLWLVRFAGMGLEDYRLETVAQSVLGRGKRIEEKPGESRVAAVQRLYREDPEALCAYCLEDARLVLEILRAEGLLELAVRKSLLIGTSLEQTSMSVAAFEFLYMENLHRRGIVAPTLGVDLDVVDRAPGGGIITPRAGLYANVLAFDFKSLYPSIIRTFNIDPMTRVRDGAGRTGLVVAPNGAAFSREPAILPGLLDRFFDSRDRARKAGDKRAVYAYKIVMNSFYGVLGTPGCRFAASALAGAITTLGQHILYWTRDLVSSRGLEVIYGDTDSLFVLAGVDGPVSDQELSRIGSELAVEVNARLAAHVRDDYGVQSRLELEFEAVYRRFFLPPMRTAVSDEGEEEGESRGRAKGYAGLRAAGAEGGILSIVGMEAVRHDWTPLAQELQREMLRRVFHDAPSREISELVSLLLRDLRAGRKDDKLVYRKALRKRVEAYTRSSPPHARAAALLPPEERSGIIRYVMTTMGPQPEGRLSAPPDYQHYVEKQVQPIVEAVAPYIGLEIGELFSAGGQLGLF